LVLLSCYRRVRNESDVTFSAAGARAHLEENSMQSTDARKRYMRMKEMAAAVRQREALHATLKAAMAGGVVLVTLVLLFLASVVYVVFDGTYEVAAAPEAEISIAALAAELAYAGGARRIEKASGSYAKPINYSPASYVNRGRDGDYIVVTYEHD
jgi:hypothetical protein